MQTERLNVGNVLENLNRRLHGRQSDRNNVSYPNRQGIHSSVHAPTGSTLTRERVPSAIASTWQIGYFEELDRWQTQGIEGEGRAEAVAAVRAWIERNDVHRDLNLNSLGLTSLPNLPHGLRHLVADNNRLRSLRNRLPAGLQYLSIENNRLTHLPEDLPPSLKYIHVGRNLLHRLPRNLPASLTHLDIAHNRLSALPENLHETVKHVFARGNQITRLPEALPQHLETLDANFNYLSSLPETLQRLRNCYISVEGNPIAPRVRHNLAVITSEPNFVGPQIIFSVNQGNRQTATQSLERAVSMWYDSSSDGARAIVGTTWRGFAAEDGADAFSAFLTRLRQTVNCGNAVFHANTCDWLNHLATNPSLRQQTFKLAFDSTSTCEDRISYVLNEMKKARLADDVEQGKHDLRLDQLILLARSMFRLDRLAALARVKVKSLQLVDEIEVFLAYQVKLRDRLALPLDTIDMRFYDVSYVTEEDLAAAETQIRTDELTDFPQYLASAWSPWQSVLKRLHPTGFREAKEKIENEKLHLNEQLQHELDGLIERQPPGWLDCAMRVKNQFDSRAEELASRINMAVTLDFLTSNGMQNSITGGSLP